MSPHGRETTHLNQLLHQLFTRIVRQLNLVSRRLSTHSSHLGDAF